MAWLVLLIAGGLEIVWAYFLKQSQGFSRLGTSMVAVTAIIASLALLTVSMRTLPLGTAYAVWSGIGAAGTFLIGIFVLGEPAGAMRLAAAAMILGGIVLLKVSA